MFNVPTEEMSEVCSFYNPISTTGYLTPLQRKKLREKRKLELSDGPHQNDPTPPTKIKKAKIQGSKPKNKETKKSRVLSKKPVKKASRQKTPDSRSIASDLLVKGNYSSLKERKFFKSRSPQHLKKAKFQPMSYNKRTRLDFGNPVNNQTQENVLLECNHEEELEEEKHVGTLEEEKEVFLDGLIEFEWPSDAELRQRQLKAREELLNSRIAEERKENVKEAEPPKESAPKLYPIFLKAKYNKPAQHIENKRASQQVKGPTFAKETLNGGVQTYIDAGQKEVGARVCPTCNMIYTIAQEQDENLHSKYHNTYLTNLKFPGWLNENEIGSFIDGRVILVKGTDKHSKLKKVQDVLFIANRDLGFPSGSFPTNPDVVFLLFISNEKRVCGCLVAESIESACPVVLGSETDKADESSIWRLGSWYASTTPVKAICGVNRIWVAKDFRRKKVASRMLDCLRQNFLFGHVISLTELAFTDPTPDGRQLAASYTKTDNFLVYK